MTEEDDPCVVDGFVTGSGVNDTGSKPARDNQSNLLIQEADTLSELSEHDLSLFMKISERGTKAGVYSCLGAAGAETPRQK